MKSLMSKIYFIALISAILFMFTNCGLTPQLSKEVCDYTDIICDYSDVICEYVPESCWYINVVCVNLSILCNPESMGSEKEIAMETLRTVNLIMKQQMEIK